MIVKKVMDINGVRVLANRNLTILSVKIINKNNMFLRSLYCLVITQLRFLIMA